MPHHRKKNDANVVLEWRQATINLAINRYQVYRYRESEHVRPDTRSGFASSRSVAGSIRGGTSSPCCVTRVWEPG
ncbi:hypothetical protein NDU88_001778 [Pleurodeles waltl]|uniref:Uncharacterized protein n=1 Tax=Pleurodeles waltl TaxID=8319 RepID=A0AAV7RCK1_PLEWA|nr:hypothetical protein NDU88_001778 [Pleurodeles waltl]